MTISEDDFKNIKPGINGIRDAYGRIWAVNAVIGGKFHEILVKCPGHPIETLKWIGGQMLEREYAIIVELTSENAEIVLIEDVVERSMLRIYVPEKYRLFYAEKSQEEAYKDELSKIDVHLSNMVVSPQFNSAYTNVRFEICVNKHHEIPEEMALAFMSAMSVGRILRPGKEKFEVVVKVSIETDQGKKFLQVLTSTPKQ